MECSWVLSRTCWALLAISCWLLSSTIASTQPAAIEVANEWDPSLASRRPVVRINDKGQSTRVNLSSLAKSVDRVVQFGSRLLVIGRSSAAEMVSIAARDSGKVEDEFLGYDISVSPSGRYVAFERFWQAHGPDVAPVVMVYDVTLNRRGNRLSDAAAFDALKFVGRPIYPVEHASRDFYIEEPRVASTSRKITNLFWLDNSTVAFIAYVPGQSRLVVVKGKPNFMRPEYEFHNLDHTQVVNPRSLGDGDDAALQFSGAVIGADSGADQITIVLPEGDQFRTRLIHVRRQLH